MNKLRKNKIKVIDIIENSKIIPIFSAIISNLKNGERTVLTSYSLKEKFGVIERIPEDFDICLMDGFLTKIAQEVAVKAKHSGKLVVLDGGSWKKGMIENLKYVDYAVCSSDFYPPGCKTLDENINFLLKNELKTLQSPEVKSQLLYLKMAE